MRTALVFALLSIVFAPGAFAGVFNQTHPFAVNKAECTTVDLRPEFGPARSQGNIGWCYANVAADLLTYYYKKDLKGQRVSSGYTALTFNEHNANPALTEGGVVGRAIHAVAEEGFLCPESLEIDALKAGPKMRIKQKLDSFVHFKRLYDQGKTDPTKRKIFVAQLQTYRSTNSTLFRLKENEIASLLQSTTEDEFPIEFARLLCRDHRIEVRPPIPHMIANNKESFMNFMTKLSPYVHTELEEHKPVAISYAAQFLFQTSVPDWRFSLHRLMTTRNDTVARHASMIVGRRWNDTRKRCEFILRNSWGTNCKAYANAYFQKPEHCEAGNLFVSDRFLETQMYGIYYFDSPYVATFVDPVLF